jgi:hypothetical protein
MRKRLSETRNAKDLERVRLAVLIDTPVLEAVEVGGATGGGDAVYYFFNDANGYRNCCSPEPVHM